MPNTKIKAILKAEKIAYWQIAAKIGVHENTILRKLRYELSEADRAAFEKAISEIKAEKTKTA